MIDFAKMAQITKEGQARAEAILAKRFDNFDQYEEVNKIDDLDVAKVVMKRFLDKIKDLEQDVKDLKESQRKRTVDSIISDAGDRAKQSQDGREICIVTFRRTYGVGLAEFEVLLDIVPEDYRGQGQEFLLNVEERQAAYDKAVEVVGDDDISHYVIGSARMERCGPDFYCEKDEMDI